MLPKIEINFLKTLSAVAVTAIIVLVLALRLLGTNALEDEGLIVDAGKKYFQVKYNRGTGKWKSPHETSAI